MNIEEIDDTVFLGNLPVGEVYCWQGEYYLKISDEEYFNLNTNLIGVIISKNKVRHLENATLYV